MTGLGASLWYSIDSRQGGRNHMEDVVVVKLFKRNDQEVAYLAVFDGHGGAEAAQFAKEHLLDEIIKLKGFWSDDDVSVMKAIKEGFITTHKLMWKNVENWPRTAKGHLNTSGCTASIVLIKQQKMYVGHVGDSGIVLAVDDSNNGQWRPHCVTMDHKPESPKERERIEACGGSIKAKAGVFRVVWNRPKINHSGPIRRSTEIEKIPFLSVARSLGDLWSYNSTEDLFVVSPEPDVSTYRLDPIKQKCLILASDGLWNMVRAKSAVDLVHNWRNDCKTSNCWNSFKPACSLVEEALRRWDVRMARADNTSVIVAMLAPEGHEDWGETDVDRPPSTCSTIPAVEDEELVPTIKRKVDNLCESDVNSSPDIEMEEESDSPNLSLPPSEFTFTPIERHSFVKPTLKRTPPRPVIEPSVIHCSPSKIEARHMGDTSPGPSQRNHTLQDRANYHPSMSPLKPLSSTHSSQSTTEECVWSQRLRVKRESPSPVKLDRPKSLTPTKLRLLHKPQIAFSPKQPNQDAVALNSPSGGMISPIWPSNLNCSQDALEAVRALQLDTPSNSASASRRSVSDSEVDSVENVDTNIRNRRKSLSSSKRCGAKRKVENAATALLPAKRLRFHTVPIPKTRTHVKRYSPRK